MHVYTEVVLVGMVVAVACALVGAFLVLRRMALLSDAISHAILLGIVLAYFLVRDLSSPLLILGAALSGVLTVWLIELAVQSRRLKGDAAIGLVFPVLFAIAVILITHAAGNVHLDTDAVLMGELAFAPLDRLVLFGLDLPKALWVMGAILLLNAVLIAAFYKELKLTTFDAGLAFSLGFAPVAVHYALVSLVSLTVVGAFDAVGSILVVALMIVPPAAAYLCTRRLEWMLGLSVLFGALSAVGGFYLALWLDVSVAGAMAAVCGLIFTLAVALAPEHGLLAQWSRRRRQRLDFAARMLAVHLLNHEGTPRECVECHVAEIPVHLHWGAVFAAQVVGWAERHGQIQRAGQLLKLTVTGRARAVELVAQG